MRSRLAQVWIETVLYTIVGLAIIGIVLAFVIPKVNQARDNVVIEQSITSMKELDSKIKNVISERGNIGRIDLSIKRGYLYINSSSDEISLIIEDLSTLYSEDGVKLKDGNLNIVSVEGSKKNSIYLSMNYTYNITYDGIDQEKKFNAAPLSYKLSVENKNNKEIDIKEV